MSLSTELALAPAMQPGAVQVPCRALPIVTEGETEAQRD